MQHIPGFVFYKGLDSGGKDLGQVVGSVNDLVIVSKESNPSVGFNTVGFIKSYIQYPLTPTPWFGENDGIYVKEECDKLAKLQRSLVLYHGYWYDEYPEQVLSIKHMKGHEKVLEIGGNIGRNSLIIASLLQNPANLVVMECDLVSVNKLSHNRDVNRLNFHVEPSALSLRPLIQRGWETKASDVVLEGYTQINTINYKDLVSKYYAFDTLVADCEGALYYILQDMPEMLENINKIIMENDYQDINHKIFVDSVLKGAGFVCVESLRGGWEPCYDFFYQVWTKESL